MFSLPLAETLAADRLSPTRMPPLTRKYNLPGPSPCTGAILWFKTDAWAYFRYRQLFVPTTILFPPRFF